jgi:voltage-gated potassium channel
MNLPAESTLSPRGLTWVARTSAALDMLAIAFLVAFVLLWAFPEAPSGVRTLLDAISWVVWGAFVIDYFVRLTCSIPKVVFVRTHKLDLLMVLVPMLRLLRVFLVLRKALSSVSTEKIAGSIVSLVVIIVLGSAFFVWRVEVDAPGATITTFRDAVWWAIVTTTTVGYGDYTPVTAMGRAIAVVVMIVGIGLIGTVSATVAAFFVTRRKTSKSDDPEVVETTTHEELLARLDALSEQQAEIRSMLERMTRSS